MPLTTAQLVSRCETRFKDTANEVVSEVEWLAYLNEAYQEVNGMYREWPWHRTRASIAVTAGDNSYPVSAYDVWAVTAVYDATNDYSLTPSEGTSQYRWENPDDTARGQPVYYRWHGSELELWPVPESNLTLKVDYDGSLPDLDTVGPVNPRWPDRHLRILIEVALARAYLDDGNSEQASAHQAVADRMIVSMTHDVLSTRAEFYPRIVDDVAGY